MRQLLFQCLELRLLLTYLRRALLHIMPQAPYQFLHPVRPILMLGRLFHGLGHLPRGIVALLGKVALAFHYLAHGQSQHGQHQHSGHRHHSLNPTGRRIYHLANSCLCAKRGLAFPDAVNTLALGQRVAQRGDAIRQHGGLLKVAGRLSFLPHIRQYHQPVARLGLAVRKIAQRVGFGNVAFLAVDVRQYIIGVVAMPSL